MTEQLMGTTNRSYAVGALVDIEAPGAHGVLLAHGSPFGGHVLYVRNNRLHYTYNSVGLPEQRIVATTAVPVGRDVILSAAFDHDGEDHRGVATGMLSLWYGEQMVARERLRTQPGTFVISGGGSSARRDGCSRATFDYPAGSPSRFTGGTITRIAVDVIRECDIGLAHRGVATLTRE